MNLITNRQLNRNQKQVIYELTLKKRQSKKSTMSEKQLAAREQLAKELMLVRILPTNFELEQQHQHDDIMEEVDDYYDDVDSILTESINNNNNNFKIYNKNTTASNNNNNNNNNNNYKNKYRNNKKNSINNSFSSITIANDDQQSIVDDQPSTSGSIGTITTSGISCCGSSSNESSTTSCGDSLTTNNFIINNSNNNLVKTSCSVSTNSNSTPIPPNLHQKLLQYQHHINSPVGSSCGCSFGRSDSSYSGSSQDSSGSAQQQIKILKDFSGTIDEETSKREATVEGQEDQQQELTLALKKEANIKFYKSKLQHLNEELQRKLFEYEYLVTKEKALLGAYNMVLFTNEGVNNFY